MSGLLVGFIFFKAWEYNGFPKRVAKVAALRVGAAPLAPAPPTAEELANEVKVEGRREVLLAMAFSVAGLLFIMDFGRTPVAAAAAAAGDGNNKDRSDLPEGMIGREETGVEEAVEVFGVVVAADGFIDIILLINFVSSRGLTGGATVGVGIGVAVGNVDDFVESFSFLLFGLLIAVVRVVVLDGMIIGLTLLVTEVGGRLVLNKLLFKSSSLVSLFTDSNIFNIFSLSSGVLFIKRLELLSP